MRKMMWIGAGFTAACLLGAYLLPERWLLAVGLLAVIAVLALAVVLRGECLKRVATYLLLGICLGAVWYWLFATVGLGPARNADGEVLKINVVAADFSYPTAYGFGLAADLTLEGRPFRAKLHLAVRE